MVARRVSSRKDKSRPSDLILAAMALFILCLAYIFTFVLTRQNCWVQVEMPEPMSSFLQKNLSPFSLAWWKEGLNYPLFEYAPRFFRPLSSYFEMFDFTFRNWLWIYWLPHQSLSLLWIFNFLLTPLFFFLFLKRIGVPSEAAILACVLWITNTGNLSVSAMYFRPAKAMTNFAIVLCLYLAARLSELGRKNVANYNYLLAAFWWTVFFSFFWDETAVLIAPTLMIVFPDLILKDAKHIALFVLWPLAVVVAYFVIIPKLTELAGFPLPDGFSYEPIQNFLHPSQAYRSDNPIGSFPYRFWHTTRIALMDSLGLLNPSLFTNPWGRILQYSTALAVSVLLIIGGVFIIRRPKSHSLEARIFILFLCYCLANVYFLATTFNGIWGLYYYGIYIPIAVLTFLALLFKSWTTAWRLPKWVPTLTCALIAASSLYIFPATNFAFKDVFFPVRDQHPQRLRAIFLNETNRFVEWERSKNTDLAAQILSYYECVQSRFGCPPPDALELQYLVKEIQH